MAAQARRDAGLVGQRDRAAAPAALWLIGAFKLAKGLILIVVGLGALHLVHRDLSETAVTITRRFHLAPGNRYLDLALSRFLSLDARQLRQISAGTFCYAALLLTERLGRALNITQGRGSQILTAPQPHGWVEVGGRVFLER